MKGVGGRVERGCGCVLVGVGSLGKLRGIKNA